MEIPQLTLTPGTLLGVQDYLPDRLVAYCGARSFLGDFD
jgi:hypothetical protein